MNKQNEMMFSEEEYKEWLRYHAPCGCPYCEYHSCKRASINQSLEEVRLKLCNHDEENNEQTKRSH